jgi:hypothetical protein
VSQLLGSRAVAKGTVLFRQQAKPRVGVAEILSDGEGLSVTATAQYKKLPSQY